MAQKIWNVAKEVLFILLVLFVLFSVVIAVLFFVPKSSTPFSVTMNAIKIAEPGEPVGTVPITIEGTYIERFFTESYYSSDQIELNITAFDGFADFEPSGTSDTLGTVSDISALRYQVTHYYAYKDGRPYSVTVLFAEDFKYWSMTVSQWDAFSRESQTIAYYLGSINENATLEEINKVFGSIGYTKVWEDQTEPTD